MNHFLVRTTALLLVVLLFSAASSQVAIETRINQVDHYEATGSINQEAEAIVLHLSSVHDQGGYRAFDVEGTMTVEMDSRTYDPTLPISTTSQDNTTVVYEGPGQLRTSAVRPAYGIFLHAEDADVRFTDHGAWDSRFTDSGSVRKPGNPAQNRDIPDVPVGGSFQVTETTSELRVQGAFWFSFFKLDMVLETPEGSSILRTGNEYEGPGGIQPEPLPEIGGRTQWREAYVTVHSGSLTVPLGQGDVEMLHAWPTQGQVNGTVQIEGQQGADDPQNFTFNGSVLTTFEGGRNGMRIVVQEPSENEAAPEVVGALPMDDEAEAAPATSMLEPDMPEGWRLSAAAAAVAVAIAMVIALAWRRRPSPLEAAERAHAAGRHARVLDLTPRLLKKPATAERAKLLHALALLEEEGPDAARLFLEWLPAGQETDAATTAFLLACIAERQGDPEGAARCLHECLDIDGSWAPTIASRPTLAEVLSRWTATTDHAYS